MNQDKFLDGFWGPSRRGFARRGTGQQTPLCLPPPGTFPGRPRCLPGRWWNTLVVRACGKKGILVVKVENDNFVVSEWKMRRFI